MQIVKKEGDLVFLDAAKPEISKPLYEYFNKALENAGVHTETGSLER